MRCSACGARYENPCVRCPECGAVQEITRVEAAPVVQASAAVAVQEIQPKKTKKKVRSIKPPPSLIEFPGVNRAAVPEWRRELGERVRERRAREGVMETGKSVLTELGSTTTATLELLPPAETPEVNPLVVAALRRIERARTQAGNSSAAMAWDYEEQPQLELETNSAPVEEIQPEAKPERVHNLAVVPAPEPVEVESPEKLEAPKEVRKPIRMIGDQNDPALNYLDRVPTTLTVDARGHEAASILLRVPGAIADLMVAALLSLPFVALGELTELRLDNPRTISFALAIYLMMTFLYLTVSIALTGRTLGMKIFSLRVVDTRTGLIPTGSQAAGRAVVYILSLVPAGIALLFTLIDRDRYGFHDRLTGTVVVRF